MQAQHTPVVLMILDGWGIAPPTRGNAITTARTPVMDHLMTTYPTMTLHAASEMVGLPWAEMGNSEVGHLNIGGGRVIFQSLPLINRAISTGSFFKNPVFQKVIEHVKKNNSTLHLIGLVSNGGVHAHIEHLSALLELAKARQCQLVAIHAILDGRDTAPNAGIHFIEQLEAKIVDRGVGRIVSMSGRYYAMDRDNRWDRIQKAYEAIVEGKAPKKSNDALEALQESYKREVFDEEFVPCVIPDKEGRIQMMNDGDGIIFFNFRTDRARQLTKAIIVPGFERLQRLRTLKNIFFVTMTEYEKDLPVEVAFRQEKIQYPMCRVIADQGLKQLHIAETEKYAHVTFFFNGGIEEPMPGESRVLIPSPQIPSYDQKPAMSAHEITERVVHEVSGGKFALTVVNFANADMLGHTGNFEATIQGIEILDTCIERITQTMMAMNGTTIITADHGNAEEMLNVRTGEIIKEHTTNPVPFIFVHRKFQEQSGFQRDTLKEELVKVLPKGVLADVAPTILQFMELPVPKDMTGTSLL